MRTATADGTALYYETAGSGGPAFAFVGDAGFGGWQWAWLVDRLAGAARTLVYDHRGTGRSDAPPGPYDVDRLAADLEAVLAAAGADEAVLVGLGLGGLVGIEYAREYDRATDLVVLGSAPHGEGIDPTVLQADRDDEAALRATTERALSPSFVDAHPEAVDDVVAWRREGDADADGWAAQAEAVRSYAGEALYEVSTPALVVHGTEDAVWPYERGRELADELPNGEFEPAPGRGHLLSVEAGAALSDLLGDRFVDLE